MKLLKNEKELFDEVILQAESSKNILISTFGLWAGIMSSGYEVKFDIASKKALEVLSDKDTKFIIGKPVYMPCVKAGCSHCKAKFEEQTARIATTMETFGITKYKIVDGYHAKYYLFDNGTSIIGGMNFSSSSWTDYMTRNSSPQ